MTVVQILVGLFALFYFVFPLLIIGVLVAWVSVREAMPPVPRLGQDAQALVAAAAVFIGGPVLILIAGLVR